ncbi:hypothetical protein [Flavobacterium sp.]|uniref:hypothetical protein n=1 Tax=Flavobacterium sp. TaxID=239 RepID=UPI0039192416
MENLNNNPILLNQQYEVENIHLQKSATFNFWALVLVSACVFALYGINNYKSKEKKA